MRHNHVCMHSSWGIQSAFDDHFKHPRCVKYAINLLICTLRESDSFEAVVRETEGAEASDARGGHARSMGVAMVVVVWVVVRRLRQVMMMMGALQVARHLRAEIVVEGRRAPGASSAPGRVRQQRHRLLVQKRQRPPLDEAFEMFAHPTRPTRRVQHLFHWTCRRHQRPPKKLSFSRTYSNALTISN